MFPSFARQTITRIRAQSIADGHGNPTRDWPNASEDDINNCVVNPGATDEWTQGRDTTLIQWTVLAQAGTDLLATDRIRYAGIVYEVDGQPMAQQSPTGALDHVVILLKTYQG